MGVGAIRVRVQIRKFLVISFRLCYRSVCRHPFLASVVCFLILLYRSFPFLFSLLVAASPVLICTAILLGTLLSFGDPNIPEIEKEKEAEEEAEEEEVNHEISSLQKAGIVEDPTFVVEKDESFRIERFGGKRDIPEESSEAKKVLKTEGHDDAGDCVPLIDDISREVLLENQLSEEVERDFDNLELGKKREIQVENLGIEEVLSHEEGAEDQYSSLKNLKEENPEDGNSPGELIEAQNGNYIEFSQESSWKRAVHDDAEEDEEASDSGSDGAESSSPDASMADILPMLDELHPLLDEEAPRPPHISHDGSDTGSEGSHRSDESSVESEEDAENQADEEEDGDGNEEDEEEAQGSREDESKSAIKWTEDDQKNLMDLGSSELERNQRLESLIARRRARRNMRLMAEKNLIDLDAADLPINIPSISTARHNPFDFPYDDVPGSAPSVLLPRQNPFDLPYDSNEEKPDLKADSFQQEFSAVQHAVFRRHESFSVGPSALGGNRQERPDLRWKPYFVPERFATEGTSYHIFQRQLSEASESKVSSVPDTESVSSAVEDEDKRISEVDVSEDTGTISNVDHSSVLVELGSLSSEEVDSVDNEQVETSDFHHDGAKITLEDVENHHEIDSGMSGSDRANSDDINTSEILLRMGTSEEDSSSRSSLSSLSEIDEKISDVRRGSTSLEPINSQIEGSQISSQTSLDSDFHFASGFVDDNEHREPVLEPPNDHIDECDISVQASVDSDMLLARGVMDENQCRKAALEPKDDNQEPVLEPRSNPVEESGISSQTSLNSDFHLTKTVVNDNQHSEPVYDSSPPSVETFHSFSSVSSDAQRSEMISPPEMAEFTDRESEAHTEKDSTAYKDMLEGSSHGHSQDEDEFRSAEVAESSENEITELGLSGGDPNFNDQSGFMRPESAVEHVSFDLPLSLSGNGLAEEGVACKVESSHKEDPLHLLSSDVEIIVETRQDGNKQLDSASSSYQTDSEERKLLMADRDYPPMVIVQVSGDTKSSVLGAEPVKEHAISTEKNLELVQDRVNPQSFDIDIHVDGFQPGAEKLDMVDSNSQHVPSNDLHLSAHEERKLDVVTDQVLGTPLDVSSFETMHMEEDSLKKEDKIQFEQDQVDSSTSDTTISAGIPQDVDLTVVSLESNNQQLLSVGKSHFELEKQQSLSDKSMLEPSFSNHDEPQEVSVTIPKDKTMPELSNPGEQMPRNTTSSVSEITPDTPDTLEYGSPDCGMDLKEDLLDKIVYEDCDPVLEHTVYPSETYGSAVAEENVNEEDDEIKEIDEGLLLELDTVGDFSVKEIVGEPRHEEQVPENTSGGPEFDFLPENSSLTEINPELPVVEVRSVEDINLVSKQIHGGANVEEVIIPSLVGEQLAEDESEHQTNSDLRVVDASASEDVQVAMKQILEENMEELADSPDATAEVNELGSTTEVPVLEVKTIEDTDLAFRQLQGVEAEKIILPSAIEQQLVVDNSKDLMLTSSDLPVVEARSLADIDFAMKQISEGNAAVSSMETDSRNSELREEDNNGSSTVRVNEASSSRAVESSSAQVAEVGSINENKPSTAVSVTRETSTVAPDEPKHGKIDETSGDSNLSISNTKGKKAKSHSSSSSSSSSDSD